MMLLTFFTVENSFCCCCAMPFSFKQIVHFLSKSSTFVSTVQTRFPGVLLNIHIETCFSIFGSRGFLLPFLFNKDFHGRVFWRSFAVILWIFLTSFKIVHFVLRVMFAGCLPLGRVAKVLNLLNL